MDSLIYSEADPDADPGLELAQRYRERLPWADSEAVLLNVRLFEGFLALRHSIGRFIAPFRLGLGPARFMVVRAIYMAEQHRLSLSEIARSLRVTSTNVTSLIDGLERDGWVTRVASTNDRRVTFAQLTAEGKAKCERLIPEVARFTAQIFASFSAEERAELNRLLVKLRRAAVQAAGKRD
jgi:DNA-binding MarR family transcriptional regulator